MNSKHFVWTYVGILLPIVSTSLLHVLNTDLAIYFLSIVTFVFTIVYAINKINEINPRRLYPPVARNYRKNTTNRLDFYLLQEIIQRSLFLAITLFLIMNIVYYTVYNVWACEFNVITRFFGFDWIIILFIVARETYEFIMDKCDEIITPDDN